MIMLFGEFKVHIVEVPGMITNRIYLTRHEPGSITFILKDGTAQNIKKGAVLNTDELYFAEMSQDQLHALAEALATKGIKTYKDSIAEGKLQATERHLEDMRLIALHKFKPTNPPLPGERNEER